MYTMYSTETSREYSVSNIETLGSAWALPFFCAHLFLIIFINCLDLSY